MERVLELTVLINSRSIDNAERFRRNAQFGSYSGFGEFYIYVYFGSRVFLRYKVYIESWYYPLTKLLHKLWIIRRIVLFQEWRDRRFIEEYMEVLIYEIPENTVLGSYFIKWRIEVAFDMFDFTE